MNSKIELGDEVQDTITGFTGIAIGSSKYLYGCTRIWIQPQEIKDGKIFESVWIDEPQLIVMTKQKIKNPRFTTEIKENKMPGGPQDNPKQNNIPTGRKGF
jgi:hypothetical protein